MPGFQRPRPDRSTQLPEPDDPNAGLIRTPFDDMHAHRERCYVEMGFSEASAAVLAGARDGGLYLWPGKVRGTLAAGATHEQALAIYA